jgi:hypothetical protein
MKWLVHGWAVFDILTERCLEGAALTLWAKSGIRNDAYPAVVPREIRPALLRTTSLRIEAKPYRANARTTELMLFQ